MVSTMVWWESCREGTATWAGLIYLSPMKGTQYTNHHLPIQYTEFSSLFEKATQYFPS